jgi:hypothetical protein
MAEGLGYSTPYVSDHLDAQFGRFPASRGGCSVIVFENMLRQNVKVAGVNQIITRSQEVIVSSFKYQA